MPQSIESLGRILAEETQDCSERVRQFAAGHFHEWIEKSDGDIPERICHDLRLRIRETFRGQDRKQAISALHRIGNRVAALAFSDLKRAQSDRQSLARMYHEGRAVLDLVRRQGRGVVYFGTSRSEPGDTEYERTRELSREMSQLLGSTTWTGAGPGSMDAAVRGAKEVGGRIGGIKIHLRPDQSEHEQEISAAFAPDEVVECRYFAPRKMGLVDAAMRESESDRTGVVILPGGFGTLDEAFEFIVLKQLKKLGTKHPVPVVLMNHSGEYDGIEAFIARAAEDGRISQQELTLLQICRSNQEALDYFADFYGIPAEKRAYGEKLCDWTEEEPET
ncbi:MAG: LOG family protein [Candidatus Peribacteraceae bacterium]|nr:LOG family protein [Candidatus Peribacteraceae bacterium]